MGSGDATPAVSGAGAGPAARTQGTMGRNGTAINVMNVTKGRAFIHRNLNRHFMA